MSEVIVVTTDDLEPAVRLRGTLAGTGIPVELLTSSETLDDVVGEPILLIITGGVRERRGSQLISQARAREHLPVIGLLEATDQGGRDTCRVLGLSDCFLKPVDVEE